ncbi:glycosyltransferase family 4 protein [Candidatus Berkelbacteria bacterium]|nr:glycosyltransferase family 4 protein [Candidatus Berkelbacteria bacterium]
MRLILDARFWRKETGGIGRYSRELLSELLKLKTDDEFHVLIRPMSQSEFFLKDPRLTVHQVDIGHYTYAEQFALPRVIANLQPDLVHFLNFNQPLGYRGRRVTTVHDLTMQQFPAGRTQHNLFRRWALQAVMRHAALSDRVVAISRATKIDLVKNFPVDPERIQVIYEGADRRFRSYANQELAAFRERVKLTKPYLLFVNQWRPHKGLPELLRAFEILKSRYHLPHQLVIAGQPNRLFPELAAAIERSPARAEIVTPGFIADDELPFYYAAAGAFVFPSHYEGFGLPVLEALQSGAPVVCSNVSSLPEVAGEAALMVPPKDSVALAETIHRILTDKKLAADLSARGRKQAQKFSWAKMAQETYELYKLVQDDRV